MRRLALPCTTGNHAKANDKIFADSSVQSTGGKSCTHGDSKLCMEYHTETNHLDNGVCFIALDITHVLNKIVHYTHFSCITN